MEHDLAALEAKISQVASLCQRLRAENASLRSQLLAATGERDRLGEKLDSARAVLEKLTQQLPDS